MFFKKKNYNVEKIYQNIVEISRSKFFYIDLELDDNFETRFDLIIFHAFMIFYYYKNLKINKSSISQNLFDYMFGDFENNLREMGFGDIAVNKKMKAFIRAFYGRLAQYSKGLDALQDEGDKSLLEQSILNNIYRGNKDRFKHSQRFVNYMNKNFENFKNKTEKENLKVNFHFLEFG